MLNRHRLHCYCYLDADGLEQQIIVVVVVVVVVDFQDGEEGTSPARQEEINRISRKLATLEMKVRDLELLSLSFTTNLGRDIVQLCVNKVFEFCDVLLSAFPWSTPKTE